MILRSLLCSTFYISRNIPELGERRKRGPESYKAHLWLYVKKKNPKSGYVQGTRKWRDSSYGNAGWIEPKIFNASTADAGKLR